METTPVTATTAANLDDKYADQLVHTTNSFTAGQMIEVADSQDVKHRGRWYMHRTVTDRSMGTVDGTWVRVG